MKTKKIWDVCIFFFFKLLSDLFMESNKFCGKIFINEPIHRYLCDECVSVSFSGNLKKLNTHLWLTNPFSYP